MLVGGVWKSFRVPLDVPFSAYAEFVFGTRCGVGNGGVDGCSAFGLQITNCICGTEYL